MFIRDKDVDALRKGIERQVRDEVTRENWDHLNEKISSRRYIYGPVELVKAQEIRHGDVLVQTDNGHTFFEAGRIEKIKAENTPLQEWEYLYFTISDPGQSTPIRSYRRRFDFNQIILRVKRA